MLLSVSGSDSISVARSLSLSLSLTVSVSPFVLTWMQSRSLETQLLISYLSAALDVRTPACRGVGADAGDGAGHLELRVSLQWQSRTSLLSFTYGSQRRD